MILAIGTKSPPKVKAITQASKNCVYFKGEEVEIISEKVESGVSDMPLTFDDIIQGAKNRSINTKKLLDSQNKTADFYVGMEGGTRIIGDKAYLFGVVYIINSIGEEHFGVSNMIELPHYIQKRLYDYGEELGPIMDEILKKTDTKKGKGAIGYLSDGMLNREQEFYSAFVTAIAPFYNKYYKL